ncbi:hypothetical protein SK128_025596 [Halocaridina rubra]|uniref:Metaxin glutathione S-transferase domain-containing protein n=1 Tax=Halocaridina rubra TaxID=373956 RepID=A0AAN8X8W5_HALRR
MEYLGRHFNKDFSSHLTDEEKAVAWTFAIMIDEHICFALRDWRWVRDCGRGALNGMIVPLWYKWIAMPIMRRKTQKLLKDHGIGRHTHAQIENIVVKDLFAISKYLGEKPFLMGDEPCEVDCSVFGCLVQIVYNYPGSPYTEMLLNEFANLSHYVHRVRERLWPDWKKCLVRP